MHRFFITDQDVLKDESFVICDEGLVHQFVKVLRFQVGEKIILLNEDGHDYLAEITEISKRKVAGIVHEKNPNNAETPLNITLFFSILKNQDKFELVLQKGTEIGVRRFVPLITARTEKQSLQKVDRLERIIREAAEQSGRSTLPVLEEPRKFSKILEENPEGINIIAHPESTQKIGDLELPKDKNINLYIGPEGGFSDEEFAAAVEEKFTTINLGSLILRAETAGIILPALITQKI